MSSTGSWLVAQLVVEIGSGRWFFLTRVRPQVCLLSEWGIRPWSQDRWTDGRIANRLLYPWTRLLLLHQGVMVKWNCQAVKHPTEVCVIPFVWNSMVYSSATDRSPYCFATWSLLLVIHCRNYRTGFGRAPNSSGYFFWRGMMPVYLVLCDSWHAWWTNDGEEIRFSDLCRVYVFDAKWRF